MKQTEYIIRLKSKYEAEMYREKKRWYTRESELILEVQNLETRQNMCISKLEDLNKMIMERNMNISKLKEKVSAFCTPQGPYEISIY